MNFQIENETAWIRTDQHIEIKCVMQSRQWANCTEVLIGGYDYSPKNDVLNGLFVSIGGKFHSIVDVIREAELSWDKLVSEDDAESGECQDEINALSSPRLTGRI